MISDKLKALLLLCLIIISAPGCKDDDDTDDGNNKVYNILTITDGGISGYTFTFPVNKAFWATATQTTRSVLMVFGSDQAQQPTTPGTGYAFFYYSGETSLSFPSAEGQVLIFNLFNDATTTTFELSAKSATITFTEVTDTKISGNINGEFNNSATLISSFINMDFSMDLAEL